MREFELFGFLNYSTGPSDHRVDAPDGTSKGIGSSGISHNIFNWVVTGWILIKGIHAFELINEMSRAKRAGRAKKTKSPALRRRRSSEVAPSGDAAPWLHWEEKLWFITEFSLYPASRVSGRGQPRLGISGQPRLGMRAWGNPSCYLKTWTFIHWRYMPGILWLRLLYTMHMTDIIWNP